MDILEEIDETIQDKKREWNYRPMREKNETDALIDQLLKEFSTDTSTVKSSPKPAAYRDYNKLDEMQERRDFEQQTARSYQPKHEYIPPQPVQTPVTEAVKKPIPQPFATPENNDMTQVFSRKAIESFDKNQSDPSADDYDEYDGSQNDNYSGYGNAGFDDDYYDENDFDEDCEKLQPDDLDLDDEEYAEFEDFMTAREKQKNNIIGKQQQAGLPKRIWRIVYTALIAAFTIIGIFSSVLYSLEKFEASPSDKKEQDEALKTEIAQVVHPVVAVYTGDFAELSDIPNEKLVALSLWEIIINGNVSVFKDAESEEILIPHTQIEYVISKLFGSEKNIEACDVEIEGIKIKYDKNSKSYVIPENHDIYTLYPVIKNVSEKDGIYTVTAQCYKDGPQWTKEKKTSPVKTVVFTMKKTSDYYNIISAVTSN